MARKDLGAAAVIVDNQGHVLLVKHSYGRLNWELPGGGHENTEAIVETALREVREETGLQVAAERLTGIYCEASADRLFMHFVFVCQRQDETALPRASSPEITDCRYWPPAALPRPISDFTVRRIVDALSDQHLLLPITIPPRQWLE